MILCGRRVPRASRDVHDVAAVDLELSQTVDLPCLGTLHLQHEHLVGVGMLRESRGTRRTEIAVRLNSVSRLGLQRVTEPADRRPGVLQALENDRCPFAHQPHDSRHVHDVVQHHSAEAQGSAVLREWNR